MSRNRNICFTLNNYTQEEEDALKTWDQPKYLIYGHEHEDVDKTPHLQGYVEFHKAMYMTALKKFNSRIHWEKRRGTAAQAAEYCKKEGDFLEFGTPSAQGKRTDLENVSNAIAKGSRVSDVAKEYPTTYIKYDRGIKALKSVYDADDKTFRQIHVKVYWGETCTGKTRTAVEESGTDWFKLDKAETVWFDGYDGQQTLIIDDFYGWIPFGQLLNILDGYQLRLQIKGGFSYAKWTKVIITSNNEFSTWYHSTSERQDDALKRRIHEIRFFDLKK